MFCHRNFCDQYVINGLKPLKMGPNCTERKWITFQPSMWRVSIYNTFQREELVRRSIFTEGKFLVYKSQDALRRQLKHCDKKHQWVVHQNSGWSLWRKHWWWWRRSRGSHSRRSRPSRGVYDCWRLRIQIFSHFTLAAANEGDVSAKTRWHKDKGMLPSNFEVLSTLWCLITKTSWRSELGWFSNSWRENVPLSRTRNVPLQRKFGGMPRVSSSTNTYTKTKVISNGTAAELRNTVTGQPWNLLHSAATEKIQHVCPKPTFLYSTPTPPSY